MYHSMTIIPDSQNIYHISGEGTSAKARKNGKNTWDDWKLIPSSRPVFNPPEPKKNFIDIPGADGIIDATEAISNYPIFNNREGSIEFYVMNEGWKDALSNGNVRYTIYDKRVTVQSGIFRVVDNEVQLNLTLRARNSYKGRTVRIIEFDNMFAPYDSISKVGFNTTKNCLLFFNILKTGKISIDAKTNPVSEGDIITVSLSWIHDNNYDWVHKYSDIMDYLHGRRMKIVLEDDPSYYYQGRLSVNEWKSEKDWSKITFDYNVDPYKYEIFATNEDWLWDPFSFIDGIIRDTEAFIDKTVSDDASIVLQIPFLYMPVLPEFHIQALSNVGDVLHINYRKGTRSLKSKDYPAQDLSEHVLRFYDMRIPRDCDNIMLSAGEGTLITGVSFKVSIIFRGGRL